MLTQTDFHGVHKSLSDDAETILIDEQIESLLNRTESVEQIKGGD